ncbi:MAG TPA: hypothetical protein DIC32_13260 [Acinetobacter radioresistens]|uniref:SGNH/GDSL hydrolase family protein n=1 Tax=Acinetobacter radioresistens TaxID=40216 RepID=A0A3D3G4X0_ACIRA|nr:hypothetical protein [Acinetobacter radioresistens]
MPIISVEKLNNANLDAETIEQVVNGEPNVLVESREGRKIPTLATLGEKHLSAGVILYGEKTQEQVNDEVGNALTGLSFANKTYATVAAANADIANIAVNQSVWVSSATEGGLYQKSTAGATSLTKSAFDPLMQAKSYTNSLATVKIKELPDSTNFNEVTEPGMHLIKSAASAATMLNCPYLSAGILEVLPVGNEYIIQRYSALSNKSIYNRTSVANVYAVWEKAFFSSEVQSIKDPIELTNGSNFNTITTAGIRKVISNTSAATMLNCPSPRAGILEVLPVSSQLIIQRYTPYGIDKKSYQRASNQGVWPDLWEEVLLKSEAQSLFVNQNAMNQAINTAFDSIVQLDYYGKKYTSAEMLGSKLYSNGVIIGFNSIHTKNVVFNSVEARVSVNTTSEIEYRIWMSSKVSTNANGYSVSTKTNVNNPDFVGVCKSFPRIDNSEPQLIELDKIISIPSDTPYIIAFRALDNTRFNLACFATRVGNIEDRSFNLSTDTIAWANMTALGNADKTLGFYQAGFKLLVTIPSDKSVERYLPELVLPPKIYALSGLESRIYFEHIIKEDYKLYDYDFECSKGQQRNRGYMWAPNSADTAGTYPLSLSILDKQSGQQLASASSNLQLVSATAKSGQTVKVQVIGDSLVNSGSITQGLLNIANNDATKIELVGTRGTGLNKHEGRGGWKISDYTSAGPSNYKFTVSGVEVPPNINATTYTHAGVTYRVQEISLSAGSGYIICDVLSGTPSGVVSGTLTKNNAGFGDASILFSAFEAVAGNPFWDSGSATVNYAGYLSKYSLVAPSFVFIQLGINDVFTFTDDDAVTSFCVSAFAQLDALINSIRSAVSGVKVIVVAPPVGANQDAFGLSYGCNQTSRRFKRNLVTYNKQLYAHYKNKEASSIYVLGAGVGVDTENNFPVTATQINAYNTATYQAQSNGVHPDESGYFQLSAAYFPVIKAI